MDILERVSMAGVIPVIKIEDPAYAIPLANAIMAGGIRTIEVTVRNDTAFQSISLIHENVPGMMVGAGTILTPEMVDDAFDQAAAFFADHFQDHPMAFFCESWLTFPKMDDLLPLRSNLRHFKERFEIIHTHLYEKGDYSEMWRLYDMDYTGNLDDFPADSSLRRNYLRYLKEGGQVGEGYGVFFR